jgi:hypothetical protein
MSELLFLQVAIVAVQAECRAVSVSQKHAADFSLLA